MTDYLPRIIECLQEDLDVLCLIRKTDGGLSIIRFHLRGWWESEHSIKNFRMSGEHHLVDLEGRDDIFISSRVQHQISVWVVDRFVGYYG